MRRLTHTQAERCEISHTPRDKCRCRCGGRFHGAGRGYHAIATGQTEQLTLPGIDEPPRTPRQHIADARAVLERAS